MSTQSTSLPAVEQLPAETAQEAAQELVPAPDFAVEIAIPLQKPAKKERIRRLLLAGAAIAVLASASWYGWDYWTVGRFLVSTDDA
jgi:membrane fusion protein (multidrug efflux system)